MQTVLTSLVGLACLTIMALMLNLASMTDVQAVIGSAVVTMLSAFDAFWGFVRTALG